MENQEFSKTVTNRLNRTIGHLEAIRRMVEEGRPHSDILVQIASVKSTVNSVGKLILEDYIRSCVKSAIETGEESKLEEVEDAVKKFLK